MTRALRITWLCPDDIGGGVVSVAQGCCKEAALAGHDVTLLMALTPTGHVSDYGASRLASLDAKPPHADIPKRLVAWLEANPQDVLVLNGCEQADAAIPYLPASVRVIYGVHDTADRYFEPALKHEAGLDGIIAVSETVASKFRSRLRDSHKLHVAHNGTAFPAPLNETLTQPRHDDLVFLGGDNAVKGSHDVLALWPILLASGFSGRLHWFGGVGAGIHEQISALPAADRIMVHGRQPRHAIFDVAGQCKVVLVLTRADAFGMATVECMGMGCLAVAWDIETGTKEIINKPEGVFIALGDYDALASGVQQAIKIHASVFEASTSRIRQEFSETAMWSRYAGAFDSILGRPRAVRNRAGQIPPLYRPPLRLYQMLPSRFRSAIRDAIGRSPRLGYALRDFRGK
jgi:glycosyltransferase involved in cell wall biosynthesis